MDITSTTTIRLNGESSEPVKVKTVTPVEAVVQTVHTIVTKVQHAGQEPTIVTKKLVTTLNQTGKPETTLITDEK